MVSIAISTLKREISELKEQLQKKEDELCNMLAREAQQVSTQLEKLSKEDVERFSRQIILPGVGCEGQLALKAARILIVGVGGLGCPAAQYLAGAGIGHIGLVDYDTVERSNLHRQLLHNECSIDMSKVSSASEALKKLNSTLKISEHYLQFNSSNALDIVANYDVVIDATDNVATRYLLNDACVLSGKPLVSGSALRLEGQLTVYNHNHGPCYRCLFPKPPPPETVTNCGDGGVLGAVPGTVGVLQALEAMKIVLKWPDVISGQLLLFNAESCNFRKVRLRTRNTSCEVCGESPSISQLIDYEEFCRAKATDKDHAISLLKREQRISPGTLHNTYMGKQLGLLVDVRNPEEFNMCALPHSINIPLKNIDDSTSVEKLRNVISVEQKIESSVEFPVIVVCRRGNDSQRAVLKLEQSLMDLNVRVLDLEGGLHAWAKHVDLNFPIY